MQWPHEKGLDEDRCTSKSTVWLRQGASRRETCIASTKMPSSEDPQASKSSVGLCQAASLTLAHEDAELASLRKCRRQQSSEIRQVRLDSATERRCSGRNRT